jgi:hypothetical protein
MMISAINLPDGTPWIGYTLTAVVLAKSRFFFPGKKRTGAPRATVLAGFLDTVLAFILGKNLTGTKP